MRKTTHCQAYILDLNNVTVRGGSFRKAQLQGGRWQNVTIYPTVNVDEAIVENVKAHNLATPKGRPWGPGTAKTRLDITERAKPFGFPDFKVPRARLIWALKTP